LARSSPHASQRRASPESPRADGQPRGMTRRGERGSKPSGRVSNSVSRDRLRGGRR
jgi:hypothetical protein